MDMANIATATRSHEFDSLLNKCDPELNAKLRSLGVATATIFANLVRRSPGSDEARDDFRKLVCEMTKDEEQRYDWTGQCLRLHSAALGEAADAHARVARLTGFQLSADYDELRTSRKRSAEERDLRQLALHSLPHLLAEWRGKRYKRTLGQPTEHAREEGERK